MIGNAKPRTLVELVDVHKSYGPHGTTAALAGV